MVDPFTKMASKLILFTLAFLVIFTFSQQINPFVGYACVIPGYFPDPEDCTKYHLCEPNEAGDLWDTELDCPDDLVWCQDVVTCQSPFICPCSSSPDPTTGNPAPTELTSETPASTHTPIKPRNCLEIQNGAQDPQELDSSLTYQIFPFDPQGEPINVRCDFETEGGGWTILQRRHGGPKEEFYRDWVDYETGFGEPQKNYWIGLKVIHALTADPQVIRFDLSDWEGISAFALYDEFSVGDASDFYRLSIGNYSGTAGDSMISQQNMQFSARDSDHDIYDGFNCAEVFHGAWWYSSCHSSNLNGLYWDQGEQVPYGDGVIWRTFREHYYSLKVSEMKIRNAAISLPTFE